MSGVYAQKSADCKAENLAGRLPGLASPANAVISGLAEVFGNPAPAPGNCGKAGMMAGAVIKR